MRITIPSTALALLLLLALSAPAHAGLILPEGAEGAQPASDIKTLYTITLIVSIPIFLAVEGLLIWCMWRYRAKPGAVAAQIHGNTKLELSWTIGAAMILVFLAAVTFWMLPGIRNPAASDIDENGNPVATNVAYAQLDRPDPPAGASMNVIVDGSQYAWQFTYPERDGKRVYGYTDMYVPVGMTITLDISSNDVQHSWWIPELGGKFDALPGYVNKTWFKVSKPGVFKGQCAELCGRNHANMYARVIALPFDEWKAWYDKAATDLESAKKAIAKEREE